MQYKITISQTDDKGVVTEMESTCESEEKMKLVLAAMSEMVTDFGLERTIQMAIGEGLSRMRMSVPKATNNG